MPTDQFYEDLSRWIDGELPPERHAQFTAHLKSCAACREALREYTQLSAVLRSMEVSDAPAYVTDNAMRLVRARARAEGKSRWPHILRAVFDLKLLKVGMCATAVLVAVVLVVVVSRRNPTSSSVQVANVVPAVPATSQPGSEPPTLGAPERAPFARKAEALDQHVPSRAATYSPPEAGLVRPGLQRSDNAAAGPQDCRQGYAAYREQHYAEAKHFYELGADKGDAECMYGLGQLYAEGSGVNSDYTSAQSWYQKSADQGYAPALYGIGLLYLKGGPGIKQDSITACRWFRMAAERGVSSAKDLLAANPSCG